MENLRNYLETDGAAAKENNDFTPYIESRVNAMMKTCANDTNWDLEEKDMSSDNFGWFANCVRNNVFNNKALN